MTMPALALVGASGRIQNSTDSFRMQCGRAAELCEHLVELEGVLSGQADQAFARLDDVEAKIEAVVDAAGTRCALLTLAVDPDAASAGENAILREPLDDSPAIVWLKDLEGKYTRVNRQFISLLGGSEEELRGRTDDELPTAATVDGPRHQDPERAASEPVEFGYTVPAYQDRPALSVLRFLVNGADGEPVAVCGVAAPMAHSEIAEDEAARLMQLNRWSRLDPESIRSDVLEGWGVRVGDAADPTAMELAVAHVDEWETASEATAAAVLMQPEPDPAWEAELKAVTSARDEAISIRDEAMSARDEAMSARAALEERVRSLELQLEQARFAAEPGSEPVVGDAAEAIAAARAEAEAARAGADQARAEADAARSVAMTAHAETEAARAETEAAREAARAEVEAARADAEAARAQVGAVQDELASLRAEAEAARTEAAAARTESASAWTEAENERTNADLFASQLADARRQLQHQRAQAALAQQQLQIPRCSAAAQASRPSQKGLRIESAVQIPRRARKPVAQPLDPTLMSQPAPASGGASSEHEGSQRGGLLGRLRSRGRH
jgi:PAS domain-containing protein